MRNSASRKPLRLVREASAQPDQKQPYGWRPECARDQRVVLPSNNWLVYQAQSYLGRQVSLEEAQELFSRIDVQTRQPIQPPRPRRWYDGLLDRLDGLLG